MENILLLMFLWNAIGFFILCVVAIECSSVLSRAKGLEFVNPCWIYKNYRVNYFGTMVVSLIYNLVCPIASICYWFYKLCTVGRKK